MDKTIGGYFDHPPYNEHDEKETFVPSQEATNIKVTTTAFHNYYEYFLTFSEASSRLKREETEKVHIINKYYLIGFKLDDTIYALTYEDLKKALENWEKLKR